MVEAKIRVEVTQLSNIENPFYGKTTTKKVVEETFYHNKDERDNIAPFGIVATIAIDHHYDECEKNGKDIFDIYVNKYYFDEDVLPHTYHTFFIINCEVYELALGIKNGEISNLTLCKYASVGDFEDGDNPLFYFHKDEFTSFDKII